MHNLEYFSDVLILLSASVFILVVMGKLRISPVLGYLIVGAMIGKHGLNLIQNQERAELISDLGVIFLLFVIGLELSFERLLKMRWHVFGFGGLQIFITTLVLSLIGSMLLKSYVSTPVVIVIAAALSLSSTAVVLQVLAENKRQSTQVGRISFAILLMQDLAVVPLLSVVPVLASPAENMAVIIGLTCLKAIVAIAAMTTLGRIFLRPFLRIIGSVKKDEIYVTTALLIVLGAASLTGSLGLSPAMGAFLSGLLIAETEYRARVEESIMPFQGIFMALFFMAVGMSINIHFILDNYAILALLSLCLIVVKGIIIVSIAHVFKLPLGSKIHSGLLMCQGGEFAFILFSMLTKDNIINPTLGQTLLMIVTCSMAVTPLLSYLGIKLEERFNFGKQDELDPKTYSDLSGHVIICGLGKEGRVVAYMLKQHEVQYIAIDINASLVRRARAQGFNIYHGDATKEEVLKSLGGDRASALVLSIGDKFTTAKIMKLVYRKLPRLKITSRVEDYHHARAAHKLGAIKTVPKVWM